MSIMTWSEALEVVIGRNKNERLRTLCSPSNPHHKIWRDRMVAMAEGKPIDGMIQVTPNDRHRIERQMTHVSPIVQATQGGGCGCGQVGMRTTPPISRQIATAGTAFARWVASGMRACRPETEAARLAICESCEFNERHEIIGRNMSKCQKCGCFIAAKVKLPHEHCPIDKWPEEQSSDPTSNPASPA